MEKGDDGVDEMAFGVLYTVALMTMTPNVVF